MRCWVFSLFLLFAATSAGAELIVFTHGHFDRVERYEVVGDKVRLGANAVLLHQVTIGAPDRSRVADMPVVGDNVYVGAGARLIGAILQ